MPVVIPPGYAEITLEFEGDLVPDGVGAVVFGVEIADGGSLTATLDSWVASYVAEIMPNTSSSLTLTTARLITATAAVSSEPAVVGGESSNPAPPNVSLHVRKRTQARGRRAIGHMYPPGMAFDSTIGVDGLLESASVAQLQTAFDDFLDGGGSQMVILYRTEGQSPLPTNPFPVVNLEVDSRISTQRKRLR